MTLDLRVHLTSHASKRHRSPARSLAPSNLPWSGWLICCLLLIAVGPIPAGAAELTVSNVQEVRTVDLTAEGSTDWMHFGLVDDSSINRKSGVAALLSYAPISVAAKRFSTNNGTRSTHIWSDGTPTVSQSGFAGGVYFSPSGSGYTITAPADHHTRTLTLHLGGYNSSSSLELSLSDASAAPVVVNMTGAAVYHHTITVTYSAAASGATLSARHVKSGTTGNAALQGVTLAGPAPNQAPELTVSGATTVTFDTPMALELAATDTDGPAPLVLSIESATPALPAEVVFSDLGNGDASFDWTPGVGDIGAYEVTFRAQDAGGAGSFATRTVTLTVVANQPPELAAIGNKSVYANEPLQFNVSATDADGPAPLILTVASATPALPGSAVLSDNGSGNGSFDWTPTADDIGVYSVTFRAAEDNGNGAFDEETVTITVEANQAPVLDAIGNRNAVALNTLQFNVSASDIDGPGPLQLEIASSTPSLPAGAVLTDHGNGTATFAWTPSEADVNIYSVTIRAVESGGGLQKDEETFLLTVSTNQYPVFQALSDQEVTIGTAIEFEASAGDADGPAPLELTISDSVPSLPGSASFVDAGNGTGAFSWTPTSGQEGVYSVTFRAAEAGGAGKATTENVTLTVNPAPSAGMSVSAPAVLPYTNNLTTQGTSDWMHFGLTTASSINRKAGLSSPQLAFSVLGGTPARFSPNATTRPTQMWSDGTPTVSQSGFAGGIYIGAGGSYRITAPADTDQRTLKVHLGGYNSTARLDVTISDGSSPAFTTNISGAAAYNHEVTIVYSANAPGSTLSVTLTRTGSSGNITLQAAALAGPVQTFALPFTDDFSDGAADGWLTVNDSSDAGNWQVVNQELRQLNRVENVNARIGTYQLGTLAYLAAGNTLTNLRFTVSATFNGTGTAEDVGVLFRYVDSNNYYRLALNSRHGYTRLEKRVGGTFSTLAVNSRGYRQGQQLNLVIEARGSNLFIWINNDPVFAVTDSSLPAGTVGLYAKDAARFDNVSLSTPGTTPAIVLTSPLAFSTTSANTLNASALASNVPAGGSVQFLLNGGNAIVDSTAPFTATFNGVAPGSHEVVAILRNAANTEVARDTNTVVGATGEKLLAVGDSITNGSGDAYASDNISVLERFIGFQGPQPNLISALDNTRGGLTPTLVFNEGIGGDETYDAAFSRIVSILERHTAVNRILIGLGTNDAFVPVASGLGCSGAACNGTFKGNLQTLVDRIVWQNYPTNTVSSGIAVMVALTPPSFTSTTPWTAAANNLIREYNQVIQSQITGIQVGPNLFNYFMPASSASTHKRSLFADSLHPNGLGYQAVAALWHNALEPASPISLPFVLGAVTSSVSTNKPQQDLIEVGDLYRLNTTHVITGFPPVLAEGRWIKTNNNTANDTSNYLSFSVDRPVAVYIAYDGGATARPAWMSGFADTGLSVSTTDSNGPTMRLYLRTYAAGNITLGGNKATGSVGSNTNYFAIVVEN